MSAEDQDKILDATRQPEQPGANAEQPEARVGDISFPRDMVHGQVDDTVQATEDALERDLLIQGRKDTRLGRLNYRVLYERLQQLGVSSAIITRIKAYVASSSVSTLGDFTEYLATIELAPTDGRAREDFLRELEAAGYEIGVLQTKVVQNRPQKPQSRFDADAAATERLNALCEASTIDLITQRLGQMGMPAEDLAAIDAELSPFRSGEDKLSKVIDYLQKHVELTGAGEAIRNNFVSFFKRAKYSLGWLEDEIRRHVPDDDFESHFEPYPDGVSTLREDDLLLVNDDEGDQQAPEEEPEDADTQPSEPEVDSEPEEQPADTNQPEAQAADDTDAPQGQSEADETDSGQGGSVEQPAPSYPEPQRAYVSRALPAPGAPFTIVDHSNVASTATGEAKAEPEPLTARPPNFHELVNRPDDEFFTDTRIPLPPDAPADAIRYTDRVIDAAPLLESASNRNEQIRAAQKCLSIFNNRYLGDSSLNYIRLSKRNLYGELLAYAEFLMRIATESPEASDSEYFLHSAEVLYGHLSSIARMDPLYLSLLNDEQRRLLVKYGEFTSASSTASHFLGIPTYVSRSQIRQVVPEAFKDSVNLLPSDLIKNMTNEAQIVERHRLKAEKEDGALRSVATGRKKRAAKIRPTGVGRRKELAAIKSRGVEVDASNIIKILEFYGAEDIKAEDIKPKDALDLVEIYLGLSAGAKTEVSDNVKKALHQIFKRLFMLSEAAGHDEALFEALGEYSYLINNCRLKEPDFPDDLHDYYAFFRLVTAGGNPDHRVFQKRAALIAIDHPNLYLQRGYTEDDRIKADVVRAEIERLEKEPLTEEQLKLAEEMKKKLRAEIGANVFDYVVEGKEVQIKEGARTFAWPPAVARCLAWVLYPQQMNHRAHNRPEYKTKIEELEMREAKDTGGLMYYLYKLEELSVPVKRKPRTAAKTTVRKAVEVGAASAKKAGEIRRAAGAKAKSVFDSTVDGIAERWNESDFVARFLKRGSKGTDGDSPTSDQPKTDDTPKDKPQA
jgi:hypothetical protein